jgi:hypothetical protein
LAIKLVLLLVMKTLMQLVLLYDNFIVQPLKTTLCTF